MSQIHIAVLIAQNYILQIIACIIRHISFYTVDATDQIRLDSFSIP